MLRMLTSLVSTMLTHFHTRGAPSTKKKAPPNLGEAVQGGVVTKGELQ